MMANGFFIDDKAFSVAVPSVEAVGGVSLLLSFAAVCTGCDRLTLIASTLFALWSMGRDAMLICVVDDVDGAVFRLWSDVSFGLSNIRGLSGTDDLSSLSLFFAKIIGRLGSYDGSIFNRSKEVFHWRKSEQNEFKQKKNEENKIFHEFSLPYFDWIFCCVYSPTWFVCQLWQGVSVTWQFSRSLAENEKKNETNIGVARIVPIHRLSKLRANEWMSESDTAHVFVRFECVWMSVDTQLFVARENLAEQRPRESAERSEDEERKKKKKKRQLSYVLCV